MEILSLEKFKNMFATPEKDNRSFNDFLVKAKVKVGSNMHPLKDYSIKKNIEIENLNRLFEYIQNRNHYLERFYTLSLRINASGSRLSCMKPMKNGDMNNNEESLSKNIIRNIHWRDILKNTKSGIENIPTFIDVLQDLFLKDIIDYKILTPSSLFYLKNGRMGSVFSSYYFRASIMNPYLVYSLNESVLKGTRIFTPTLGWSSYCYGFLESKRVLEYVGTDVIPSVCEKTKQMAKIIAPQKTVDIYCKPSEDLYRSRHFLDLYREHFDVVFFSPPYYRLELYEGKQQSTEKYKSYEEWLEKYWENTIKLCYHVLENGGKLCYILSGYGSQSTKEQYDLITDMNNITKKYFKFKGQQPMYNKNVNVTAHKNTDEHIMIFIKK
jgi:hypothetical protein